MKKLLFFVVPMILVAAFALREGLRLYERFERFRSLGVQVEQKGKSASIEVNYSGKGGFKYFLKAASARLQGDRMLLEDVVLRLFSPKAGGWVEIRGKRGMFNRREKVGTLTGKVVVGLKDERIYADSLRWWQRDGKVCIPGSFVMKGRYEVYGSRLCFFLDRDRVVIDSLKKVVLK